MKILVFKALKKGIALSLVSLLFNIVLINILNAQPTWSNVSSSTDWNTGGNWSTSIIPPASTVAQFATNPTPGTSVNLSASTNPGAIYLTTTRSLGLTIGSASGNNTLTLSGVVANVNGTPNTILSNFALNPATSILTLQNGSGTMPVVIPSGKFIVTGAGTSLTLGNTISLASVISGGGGVTTLWGNGTFTGSTGNLGGLLQIGNSANTFTGGINVGQAASTFKSGILELTSTTALATGNPITIYSFSQLYLNAAGTFNTNSLTLNGVGVNNPYTGRGSLFCNNKNITFPGNITVSIASLISNIGGSTTLTLSGTTTLTATCTDSTAPGSSSTVIGNVIAMTGNIGGAGGLIFLGGGAWNGTAGNCGGLFQLGGTNTYTGSTTMGQAAGTSSGILELNSSGAINNSGTNTVTIHPNSQLYLNAPDNSTFTTAGALSLSAKGNISSYTGKGVLITRSGNSYTWAGPVTLANSATINAQGTGTLSLTGTVTQTGASAFYVGAGSASSIGGVIALNALTGAGSDTVLGNGTWNGTTGNFGGVVKISGTNASTGGIIVGNSDGTSSGILELTGASSGGAAANNITINNNSQLYLNGTTGLAYTPPTTGALTLTGNGASSANGYTGKGALFTNGKTFSWGSTVNIAATGAMITALGGPTYSLTLGNTVTLNGNLTDSTAPGTTSSVGSSIVMSGIVRGAGNINFLGGGTWNGSTGNFGGLLKLSNANTFTGILNVGNSNGTSNGILELTGGTSGSNSAAASINIYPNSQLFLNGVTGLGYTTLAALTLIGTGAGANGYTGRGAMFSSGKTFSWSGPITVSNSGAMITVAGGNTFSVTMSGAFTNNGPCVDSTAPGTTTLVGSAIVNSGPMSGNGSLTFLGGGTWDGTSGLNGGLLRLTRNTNTMNGGITVGKSDGTSSGILQIDSISALGANNITIHPNSQLYLNSPSATAIYNSASVTLTLNGSGNNVTTTYGRGALKNGVNACTWPGPVVLATNAVINTGTALTLSGNISGGGQLNKDGVSGVGLILTGTGNSWTGGTKVSNGAITVNAGSALSTGDVIFVRADSTIATGATITLNNGAQTINSLSSSFTGISGTRNHVMAIGASTTLTINQSSNTTFGAGAVSTLASTIYGVATSYLVKTGSGRLTLNSPGNYFYGGLTITAGEICLNPVSAFTLGNGANRCPVNMNGGTLSTTGIGAVVCSLGTLNNVANSTIVLDATSAHSLRFTGLGTNTGVLNITGWQGVFDSSSGTAGKLYIGTTASLNSSQLAQIHFTDAGNNIPAVQMSTGEIVPKVIINITPASYGPIMSGTATTITVSYSTSAGYLTGNFKVQLSNSLGAFSDYTNNIIGTGTTSLTGTITAVIPSTAAVGGYRVRVINTVPYSVSSGDNGSNILINGSVPVITSVSSYAGVIPGSTITINGINFNSTYNNNLVYFGGVRATANSGSTASLLSVTVPYGAALGPLTVYDSVIKIVGQSDTIFVPGYNNTVFDTSSASYYFANKVDYTVNFGPNIAGAADLDGDGDIDLVATSRAGAPTLTILQNGGTGIGSFTTVSGTFTLPGRSTNLKIGDIDNDGRPDIVVADGTNAAAITVYRNTTNFSASLPRTMTFVRADISISSVTQKATLVELADFDEDGKLDIAIGCVNSSIDTLLVLHNNTVPGTINLASFSIYSFSGDVIDPLFATAAALAVADFDGDGKPDVAMVNENGYAANGSVSIFKNTSISGSVAFNAQIPFTVGTFPADIQTADLNNDGAADLVITNAIFSDITILKNPNDHTLNFGSTTVSLISGGKAGIALSDFDADGKVDMAIANNSTGANSVSVYRNLSTAGGAIEFTTPANALTLAGNSGPTALTAADLDNDTYPDIIAGNAGPDGGNTGNTVSIFRNTPLPIIGSITPASPQVCIYSDTTLGYSLSLPAGVSGAWSSADTSIATVNPTTGVVHGVAAGTVTISYTVTVALGQLTRSTTRSITVNPLPVVSISGATGVCQGFTITLTGNPTPGTWADGGSAVATVNTATGAVTGVASSGTEIITYTHTSSFGCTNTDTQTISIIYAPNAGSITGASTLCEAANTTLSSTGDLGGTWSSTNTSQATVNAATGIVTGTGAGNPTIIYSVTNSCGTDTANKLMTILPLPDPGVITGTPSVCVAAVTTLNSSIGGGLWTSSNLTRATVTSSPGIVTGVAAGTSNISYTVTNSCGSDYVYVVVTVNAVPGTPLAISGNTNLCFDGITTLTDGTPGGVWSSSDVSLATVDVANGIVHGVASGTPDISYIVSNGCGTSAPAVVPVHVLSYPSAVISSANAPCIGYSTNIIFTGTSGARLGYVVDSGIVVDTILIGGTFSLPTSALSTTHYYTLHNVHNAACNLVMDTTAIVVPVQMQWVGGTSGAESNWNTAANWSCGIVPAASDDITIPSPVTFSPAVAASSTATARSITIQSGGNINLGSNAVLDMKGQFTNNGTVTGNGNLRISGTSAQHIYGIGSVKNMELNNGAGATIDPGAKVIILNTLTVTNGTLVTNDSLELASSDTSGSARVAAIPIAGAITGNVKVVQFIQGGYRRYRFWSHPFSTAISMQQLEDDIDITGTGGATNGFTTTATNASSAFRYDPLTSNSSLSYDIGWKPFTNITNTADDSNKLNRYQGIRMFLRGAKGEGLGYWFSYVPSATTISMTGAVNQGNQTVTLKKGATIDQDYNMVGNPYPSPVDIGTVIYNAKQTGNVIGAAFYVWNPSIGASGFYQAVPIGSVSPSPYYLQGNVAFQVRAGHNDDSLNFTENNKAANATTYLLKAQPDYVSLYVYDANYHPWDMLYLKFTDEAKDAEDNDYDARKLLGSDFYFYSLSADDQKLAIDARPYAAKKVIPLGITSGYTQEFIIKAEGIALPEGGKLFLHDKLLQKYVQLQQGTEYRFTISKDKTTQGEHRFELSMEPAVAATAQGKGIDVMMTPNPATDEVSIKFSADSKEHVSLRVLDITGMSIHTEDIGIQQSGTIKVSLSNLPSGIYMVELTSGNNKVTQRLVKE